MRFFKFALPFALFAGIFSHSPALAQDDAMAAYSTEPEDEDSSPTEIRRGMPTRPRDGRSREQATYERALSQLGAIKQEPTPERIKALLALYERELVGDTRLFATKVGAELQEDGSLKLTGYVMFSEHHRSIEKLFSYAGFETIHNQVELLPSERLGEEKFAVVLSPTVFLYDRPEAPRETMTEAYMGEPIFLLSPASDGHYLATSADGYVGYLDANKVIPLTAQQFSTWQDGDQVRFTADHKTPDVFIPAGSRLKLPKGALESRTASMPVQLPNGSFIEVPRSIVRVYPEQTPSPVAAAIDAAHAKLGTKYVWGGKSSEGVDCSGLVQSSYRTQGINMPRDAYMQAYVGTVSATRWYRQGLRRGDLLFFLGGTGKISHVAIALDNGDYIEAAGTVKFSSLNPESPLYDERRDRTLCFAKRLLE